MTSETCPLPCAEHQAGHRLCCPRRLPGSGPSRSHQLQQLCARIVARRLCARYMHNICTQTHPYMVTHTVVALVYTHSHMCASTQSHTSNSMKSLWMLTTARLRGWIHTSNSCRCVCVCVCVCVYVCACVCQHVHGGLLELAAGGTRRKHQQTKDPTN